MPAQPVRLILATGVFAESPGEEQWYGSRVADLVEAAARTLAGTAGEAYLILRHSARADLRRSLGGFLVRLLLLAPDEQLLRRTIDRWVEAQREMLTRLLCDREALGDAFGRSALGSKIVRIEAGLSDRHHGGRSTAVLTFAAGGEVVYKPRGMEIEAWYSRLLDWFNEPGAPAPLHNPRVLCREGYGWQEFVAHRRCQSLEELREYYRNAGSLLGLLHLVRATDAHFQNVIASGASPVLVDAETLFQPALHAGESPDVTRTGWIPNFRFGPQGQTYDVSGLGFVYPQSAHFEVPAWTANGLEFRPARLLPGKNLPFPDGIAAQPHSFVEEMVAGFCVTYRFAMQRREALIERFAAAAQLRIRYLVRETMEYYAAWQIGHPGGIALAALLPPLAAHAGLRPSELAALRGFDIPRFTTTASTLDLDGVGPCFARSGLDLALAGLTAMSEAGLAAQIQHLRLAWSLSQLAGVLSPKA